MRAKFLNNIIRMLKTMEILPKLEQKIYPTLTCLQEEVPAKIYQSLAKERVWPEQGQVSLWNTSEYSVIKNQDILFGKMLKGLCHLTMDLISQSFLMSFPKQGILSGGRFSTPKISVSLKTESVSLSSVLEKEVPKKYFLSEKIQKRLTLWGQQSEQKTLESENETLFTDRGGGLGSLKATDYKQPPQILHRFDQYN